MSKYTPYLAETRLISLNSIAINLIYLFVSCFTINLLSIPGLAPFMYILIMCFSFVIFTKNHKVYIDSIIVAAWENIKRSYKIIVGCCSVSLVVYVYNLYVYKTILVDLVYFILASVAAVITLMSAASTAGYSLRLIIALRKSALSQVE